MSQDYPQENEESSHLSSAGSKICKLLACALSFMYKSKYDGNLKGE